MPRVSREAKKQKREMRKGFMRRPIPPQWCLCEVTQDPHEHPLIGCWSLLYGYITHRLYCKNCEFFDQKKQIDPWHEIRIHLDQERLDRIWTLSRFKGDMKNREWIAFKRFLYWIKSQPKIIF